MYLCMSFHWNIFSSLLFLFFLFKIVLAFRCELFLCGAEFFLGKRTESIRDERFEHIWNRGKNRAKNRENFIIIFFFVFYFFLVYYFFKKRNRLGKGERWSGHIWNRENFHFNFLNLTARTVNRLNISCLFFLFLFGKDDLNIHRTERKQIFSIIRHEIQFAYAITIVMRAKETNIFNSTFG